MPRACFFIHFLAICLVYTLPVAAQTITGKIYRAGTDSVIAGASVYYNASTTGTATNNDGSFILSEKPDHIPLIISCVGYTTMNINEYDAAHPLTIYLTPKTQVLHEVVIGGSDGMSRKEKEKIFLREFLGTSSFAKGCTIINLKDVVLTYHQETKTLTAACDTPLQIDNKPLGYQISYFLQEFTFNSEDIHLAGNYFYKDNFLPADQNNVARNREKAYKGSRLQFIRALWANKLKQKRFQLNAIGYLIYNGPSIIQIDSGRKFINLKDLRLFINYRQGPTVLAQTAPALITNTGYYGAGLEWYGGNMSIQRIGDNLPFEYWPEEDLDEKPKEESGSASPVNEKLIPADIQPSARVLEPSIANPLSTPSVPVNNKTTPLFFEKTYLHTDRDVYTQGDTLWFKAYLMNGQDNKPVNSSGTLYVELISLDSAKIINREIIRLDNGLGNGDIALEDTLKAGSYRLRAYTNWMRNFGDNFVFEKNITILHTQATSVALAPKFIAKDKPKDKNKTAANATTLAASIITPTVNFYPEGGSLVNGIGSLVAVKAEDGYGKGIPASGAVISSVGDTLSRFSCDSLGMGLFALLPIKGLSYHVVVNMLNRVPSQLISGPDDVFNLPSALNTGLTLQVKQTDSVIHAAVSNSDGGVIPAANRPATVTMAVKHSGKTLLSWPLSLQGEQTTFKFGTAVLPEGISSIIVYDNEGKPECERLVYIHHPDKKNNIAIHAGKKIYRPKEQVTINIDAQPNANLSMAVVDAGIVPEQADDIVSYLNLQSEVKGNIENPRRYFDTTNVNRFKQLDLLLMTQGWRDFVWRRLADTAIRISYAAENGISISGKVRDENRNKWLPNLNITLFANGAKGNKMFTANSDSSGRFNFHNLMLYGSQPIKLTAANNKGKVGGALWVDTLLPLPVKPVAGRITTNDTTTGIATGAALAKREAIINNSKLKSITQLKEVTIKTDKKKFVRIPNEAPMMTWDLQQEFNITPKDYEYDRLTWFLLNNDKRAFQQDGTRPGVRYLIDGHWVIPDIAVNGVLFSLDDPRKYEYPAIAELYFNMPMEKFKKVEVHQVMKPEQLGKLTYVIILTTKPDALTDNPGSLYAGIEGYYQARTFYAPAPNAKPSINDYRTTIYWEPNIKTDASGKATVSFYNAVPQTDVRIIVQGVTSTGIPLVSAIGYNVK